MGNNCMRQDVTSEINQSSKNSEKRIQPTLNGEYKQKYNGNLNQIVKSRQQRLRTYQDKLQNLKRQLQMLQSSGQASNDKAFKQKRLQSQIAAMEKMVRNTDADITKLRTEITA